MTIVGARFHPLLIALAKGDKKLQRAVLLNSSDSLIRLLAQAAANILRGNIKVNPHQKRRLARFQSTLRSLQNRKTPLKYKRKLLVRQSGGFLPLILPIISAAIGGLISRVLNK